MKTVSSAFQIVQAKPTTKPVYRVYYKRRYWDTGTTAYIWETSWTELPQSELVSVDAVVHSLDTVTAGEFLVSNTVLRFKNDKMQWKEGTHTDSKFKPDGGSAFGYEPYMMKFQVRAGFRNVGEKDVRVGERKTGVDTGYEELVSIFTGVAVEYWMDSDQRIAYVRASGFEEFLFNSNAERVSTTVTLETVGTGDGVTLAFVTAHSGVGRVTQVTVDAVVKVAGTDYTVSNLSTVGSAATITFATAPANTKLVKATYFYWLASQKVEDLITDLLVEAGISSYSVSPVIFPSVVTTWSQTSEADWEAGSNTAVDTTTIPGSMKMDFNYTGYRTLLSDFSGVSIAAEGWTDFLGGLTPWTISSGRALQNSIDSNAYAIRKGHASLTNPKGLWSCDMTLPGSNLSRFIFFATADTVALANLKYSISYSGGQLRFEKNGVDLATFAHTADANLHNIKVSRDDSSTFRVYLDDALVITVTDSTYTTTDRIILECFPGSQDMLFDNVYVALTSQFFSQSIFNSPTRDAGTSLVTYGVVTLDQSLNDGSTLVETRTSTDGSSWDAWTALGAANTIASAVKRYIQVRVTFAVTSGTGPIVHQIDLTYSSSSVTVSMANFTGKNCYQAIQELASFADYEWGFDDDESFFFRARNTDDTPDAIFNSNSNLSEVLFILTGCDRVFSTFRATFGSFVSEDSSAVDTRNSSIELFGRRVFEITSAVLVNPDTNIAAGIVSAYKARLQSKKRRVKILTKFWPQIVLSDTLSVTYIYDAYTAPTPEPLLSGFIGKVIYTRQDPVNAVSEFELEEIL